MVIPKSAPLFKQTASVRWVSLKTLTGIWLEVFDDGDFAGKSMAPPSDELDGPTRLSGLLYPVEDCLGVSVHHVSLTTLMGVWATDSDARDFADELWLLSFMQTN
jgi:hypothetical protein